MESPDWTAEARKYAEGSGVDTLHLEGCLHEFVISAIAAGYIQGALDGMTHAQLVVTAKS